MAMKYPSPMIISTAYTASGKGSKCRLVSIAASLQRLQLKSHHLISNFSFGKTCCSQLNLIPTNIVGNTPYKQIIMETLQSEPIGKTQDEQKPKDVQMTQLQFLGTSGAPLTSSVLLAPESISSRAASILISKKRKQTLGWNFQRTQSRNKQRHLKNSSWVPNM